MYDETRPAATPTPAERAGARDADFRAFLDELDASVARARAGDHPEVCDSVLDKGQLLALIGDESLPLADRRRLGKAYVQVYRFAYAHARDKAWDEAAREWIDLDAAIIAVHKRIVHLASGEDGEDAEGAETPTTGEKGAA